MRKTIADARVELGLTQQDMADKLGISRQTYAKMEQRPDMLTIKQARDICEVFGMKYTEIFFTTVLN